MKRIILIKLYPPSKRRMLLSENLPQTSRFFTRHTDISAISLTLCNSEDILLIAWKIQK